MMTFYGSCGMRTMLGTYLPIEGDVRLVRHNGTANAAQAGRPGASVRSVADGPHHIPDDSVGVANRLAPHGYAAVRMVRFGG